MLLIGQPKSATTSLACTIAKIVKVGVRLGIPRESIDINCRGFAEIQKYHNNMIERSPLFIKQVIQGRKLLFKEHLLPTDRHLKIIDKVKGNVVILLRDVEASLDAYERLFKDAGKGYNRRTLLNNLYDFNHGYYGYAKDRKNIKIVYYKDLIKDYNHTMTGILKHYGINGKIIPLMKKKYTGVGETRLHT